MVYQIRHPCAVYLREIEVVPELTPQYRAALDAGTDPAVVGQWITETQARKLALETRLRNQTNAEPAPARA
jgi:hypothetical protein